MSDKTMPFGVHKGKKFQDVPKDYLLYVHEQMEPFGDLKSYIEDNLKDIQTEGSRLREEYRARKGK